MFHIVSALLALLILASSTHAEPAAWTLGVIGDQQFAVTQKHGHDWLAAFTSQTKWLAENAAAINLRMVTQVGDVVERANEPAEWERALAAMRVLDSAKNSGGGTGIPWSVCYGNHEILGATTKPSLDLAGRDPSATYRQYFGSASGKHRYANQSEFKGVSQNDLNTWHVIKSSDSVDARPYLMLNLEIDVPGRKEETQFDAIAWAQEIIDQHPGMATIISTHVFEGSKYGPPEQAYLKGFGHNSQFEIFDKLIKNNSQIFMVLSGHTSEETHQVKLNGKGQPVLQMVTDYNKWLGDGGDGYFRLIDIDEAAGKMRVKTYSALLDKYRTDGNGQFEIDLKFAERFAGPR
jgi:hypothetical protein